MRKRLGLLKYLAVIVLLYAIWATYVCKSYKILETDYRLGMIYTATYLYAYLLAMVIFVIGYISDQRLIPKKTKNKDEDLDREGEHIEEAKICQCGAAMNNSDKFCSECGSEVSADVK